MRELFPGIEERNYAKAPLTPEEVGEIVDAAGGVAAVINVRHEIAKARGWKDAPPSRAEFVAAAVAEPNLLRRPILVKDGNAVVGRDEAAWAALLGGGSTGA